MDIDKRPININITTLTVIKIILVLMLLYFLVLIKDVLAILFVALIFSSAVDPWVDWMQKKKLPRAVGVLLIYLVALTIIGAVIFMMIPPIVNEMGELSNNFPRYMDKISSGITVLKNYSLQHGILDNIRSNLGSYGSNLQGAIGGIFSTVSGIFGGIFSFILVMVITFYMVVEENAIKKLVWSIAPVQHQPYVMQLINRMQRKMGLWLRGQLILSLVIFILSYIGLSLLGVRYALVLALFAGMTEFIPYLGPMIGAIPAVLLSFLQEPIMAVFVIALYSIVQWTENNILVPKIMQKAVGLNPIISIAVLLMGFKIAGVVGAILAIPVATAVSVFVQDIFESKEAAQKELKS